MAKKSNTHNEKAKGKKMISVKLLPGNNASPARFASFAALSCYMAKFPAWGKMIDYFSKLFKTGHHTTFEHASSYFSFMIEGISVGDVTFGLHLTSPFYNTSQRSGRYCSSMFVKFVKRIKEALQEYLKKLFPGYVPEENDESAQQFNPKQKLEEIKEYIREFWPELKREQLDIVMDYVGFGVDVFQSNIETATLKAAELTKLERPFVKPDSIKTNAPRFAQEQLRNFIPIIVPTGLVFTVNVISLVALYESAWTPAMRYVTDEMSKKVLEKFPNLYQMFNPENRREHDWAAKYLERKPAVIREPRSEILNIDVEGFVLPKNSDRHPVDKLHYNPDLMDNAVCDIKVLESMSVATMGQDQRHRTIRRGTPSFTKEFYLPPIPDDLGLEDKAMEMLLRWLDVSFQVPATLAMVLAPYGGVVQYVKRGSLLAIDHEQGKRSCDNAQEEIQWKGFLQSKGIEEILGRDSDVLKLYKPPCYEEGKCGEGGRYCGRDISVRKTGDYFAKRKV